MRILVLSNLTSYTFNFRYEILSEFVKLGYSVTVACHNDDEGKQQSLEDLGCKMIEIPFNGKGKDPRQELRLLFSYRRIVRTEKPDIVLTYTIKMNLYGGMAAKRFKVPYVPMITGLGELEKSGKLQKVLMAMHKIVMPTAKAIFFQNQANIDFFKNSGIECRKTVLVPGSGINLSKFNYVDYPSEDNGLKFAFIGRITPAKGIIEYLSMAEKEKSIGSKDIFYVAGLCDDELKERVEKLHASGVITYLGMLSDTREILSLIHCLVLPTYHPEGLSNVLLEAASTGRPAICTSRPGCKEVVADGVNGLYCEAKNVDNLVSVINSFKAMDEEKHKKMGISGRRVVEQKFDRNLVVKAYLEIIK